MEFVLGVDPGLNNTGWGLISVNNNSLMIVDSGVIKNNVKSLIQVKLLSIYNSLEHIISSYSISAISLEITFVNNNPMSALKLGYARSLVLLLAAKHNIELFEYAPNAVKKAITGNGHADKEQVRYMIEKLLNIKLENLSFDLSDALAIALCDIFTRNRSLSNY